MRERLRFGVILLLLGAGCGKAADHRSASEPSADQAKKAEPADPKAKALADGAAALSQVRAGSRQELAAQVLSEEVSDPLPPAMAKALKNYGSYAPKTRRTLMIGDADRLAFGRSASVV